MRKHMEGRRYVAQMRGIIKTIQKKIKYGEPWPSSTNATWN